MRLTCPGTSGASVLGVTCLVMTEYAWPWRVVWVRRGAEGGGRAAMVGPVRQWKVATAGRGKEQLEEVVHGLARWRWGEGRKVSGGRKVRKAGLVVVWARRAMMSSRDQEQDRTEEVLATAS